MMQRSLNTRCFVAKDGDYRWFALYEGEQLIDVDVQWLAPCRNLQIGAVLWAKVSSVAPEAGGVFLTAGQHEDLFLKLRKPVAKGSKLCVKITREPIGKKAWGCILHEVVGQEPGEIGTIIAQDQNVLLSLPGEAEKIITSDESWANGLPDSLRSKLELCTFKESQMHLNELKKATQEAVADKTVMLEGGGTLVIDTLEAIAVVDVNGAGTNQGKNPEQIYFDLNCRAVEALQRQLRLRRIAGQIVIDFVRLHKKSYRLRLHAHAEQFLSDDTKATTVYGFTRGGLFEIHKARRRRPLASMLNAFKII